MNSIPQSDVMNSITDDIIINGVIGDVIKTKATDPSQRREEDAESFFWEESDRPTMPRSKSKSASQRRKEDAESKKTARMHETPEASERLRASARERMQKHRAEETDQAAERRRASMRERILYIKNKKAKGTGNGTPGSLEIKARKIVMSQIKARNA